MLSLSKITAAAFITNIIVGVTVFPLIASAWTGPAGAAPGSNAAAPINVSSVNQTKNGNLGVGGLAVFGNTLLQGGSYLDFGTVAGSAGYGIWDNSGVLNFKSSGGSWQSIQQIVAALVGSQTLQSVTNNGNTTSNPIEAGQVQIGLNPAGGTDEMQVTNSSGGTYLYAYSTAGSSATIGAWNSSTRASVLNLNGSSINLSSNTTVSGNVTAASFLYSSDQRLKTDIQPLTGNLVKVLQIQPVSYLWKDQSRGAGTQIGFIAQNVQQVAPQLVHTDASTTLESLDYARMSTLLVGSVQELDQKIVDQQKEIDQLKAAITALQASK